VEVIGDKALALPPLNVTLARALVGRTRIAKLLAGYRDRPAADLDAIHLVLVKISQLVADLPQVVELDINPLLADEKGVVALDARIKVSRNAAVGTDRFAIRPYPKELEEWIEFGGRRLLLRPIRSEDEPLHREFLVRIEPRDLKSRFFIAKREFAHSELARFAQVDYDREMAFIATALNEAGKPETLGVVRAIADPDNLVSEFAILVRSDLKGKGLGSTLLGKMIRYCRDHGTRELVGEVQASNEFMLALAADLGFTVRPLAQDPGTIRVTLALGPESKVRAIG
jgi:acetyltransferase